MRDYIPREAIDEIIARVDIHNLVSRYVDLKQSGRNFVGLCPFPSHKDSKPSFNVNPDKRIFKCFGCNRGGNAISFVMEYQGCTFVEAIKFLARHCGLDLERYLKKAPLRKEETARRQLKSDKKKLLCRVNGLAREFFEEQLAGPGGDNARKYLKKRGIEKEIIREFNIGYAPGSWDALVNFLRARKVPAAYAEEAGLIQKSEKSDKYYAKFRDRIIFPIRDSRGRIIAFGGRALGDELPKYINSKNSEVFNKSKNLYGIDKSLRFIRSSGQAIVVEGYFDLIMLYSTGIENVVATLGTALTELHVAGLKKVAKEIILLFDGDSAGISASERGMDVMLDNGIMAKEIVLPDNMDPDDYIRKEGRESFLSLVDGSDFQIDSYFKRLLKSSSRTIQGKASVVEKMVKKLAKLGRTRQLECNMRMKEISTVLGHDYGDLSQLVKTERVNLTKFRKVDPLPGPPIPLQRDYPKRPQKKIPVAEKYLLGLLLRDNSLIPSLEKNDALKVFSDERVVTVLNLILKKFQKDGRVEVAGLISEMEDSDLEDKELINTISNACIAGMAESEDGPASLHDEFMTVLARVEKTYYNNLKRECKFKLKEAEARKADAEVDSILREIQYYENTIRSKSK